MKDQYLQTLEVETHEPQESEVEEKGVDLYVAKCQEKYYGIEELGEDGSVGGKCATYTQI